MTGNSARAQKAPRILGAAIYIANILLIGGAVLISVWPASAATPAVFAGFFIGHMCLLLHAVRMGDRGLVFLNAAMALLDLYAVGIRLDPI